MSGTSRLTEKACASCFKTRGKVSQKCVIHGQGIRVLGGKTSFH